GGNLLLVRFRTQAGTGLWGLSLSDGRASPLVPPNRVAVRAKSIVTPWPFLREAGQTAAMASISSRKFGFASPRSTQSVLAGGSLPKCSWRIARAFGTSCGLQIELVHFL